MQAVIKNTFKKIWNTDIYTRNFIMLCSLSMVFFASHHLITTIMARYVIKQLPNPAELGLVMATFMIASLLSRPLLGKLTDEYSKKVLMMIGILFFIVSPILYIYCQADWMFYPVRIIHGIGFGLFVTASASYLIHILPTKHRGEGISAHSNAVKLALAFSPAIALHFAEADAFHWVFIISAALAVIALFVALFLPRLTPDIDTEPETPVSKSKLGKGKWINKKALFPGVMIGANSVLFGALIPFAPLMALEKDFGTIGLFYTIYVASLMASRGFTGPLSDRYGRIPIILPGMAVVIVSMFCIALAPSKLLFLASAGLYGLSAGTIQPSLIAMVADRVENHERGSAMATFTMLSDVGQAIGYQVMGTLGVMIGFSQALPFVTVFTIAGWIALFFYQKRQIPTPSLC